MSVNMYVYVITLCVITCALLLVLKNYLNIRKTKKHETKEEDAMFELAATIRKGAKTFMGTEYKTIVPAVALIAIGFSLFIEVSSGFTFILGACMSSAAVFIGMYGAVYANYRVARRAFKCERAGMTEAASVGRTVYTALKGGSISGLSVQAFGMLGLLIVQIVQLLLGTGSAESHGLIAHLNCNPLTMRLTTYSLGCSTVAMFNRVAGGNFTKAADISADIVAKIRHDMPEDDSRMPNTIADFIGDNVNDIAGNCSDLLESFVATITASLLIAGIIFGQYGSEYQALYNITCIFPIILAGIGLLGCIVGVGFAMTRKEKMSGNPSRELNLVTYISAGVTIVGSLVASWFVFGGIELYTEFRAGWLSPWLAALLGIISGVAVGKITEIYTGTDYRFVKSLANIAKEGSAFVITKGDAIGSRSCLPPILVIGFSMLLSYISCGIYGIAIAALGMLSFVGATVSIDAFGPIADNAGGIAEGCHLAPEVRKITDKLDATGNTTAAIGKGFAIGSAAYATVSLIFAYVGNYSTGDMTLNIASPIVIVGALVGGALVEYFIAMLTDNTIDSAYLMAEEGDEMLTDDVMAGKVKPDYDKIVKDATEQALKKMLVPSLLAIVIPIPCLLIGFDFVGGLLIGATIVAIPRAIFMGNSGGAFDNAKKYIEEGLLAGHGKGSDAHKAAVAGDTTGDTRKDVVGVALDIFIKTMSTVANTLAPVFQAVRLV